MFLNDGICNFFRAHGVFEGSFNHLVSWWTGGEFCHCEIVFALRPGHFMNLVKGIYKDQSETDQKRLMAAVEENIYENKEFRNMVQNESVLNVSFSLLWGDQLRLRFLRDKENIDPWFQLKTKTLNASNTQPMISIKCAPLHSKTLENHTTPLPL